MSGISSWLLSIACVVILSVLAEFILPEGQMNKYIKVMFSFVILLVIISPLPSLLGSDFNLSDYFSSGSTELQEEYLYQVNVDKLNAISSDISAEIEEFGLAGIKVSVSANVLTETLEIYGVYVDLCDLEYTESLENKSIANAKAAIKEIIISHLGEVEIEFSG